MESRERVGTAPIAPHFEESPALLLARLVEQSRLEAPKVGSKFYPVNSLPKLTVSTLLDYHLTVRQRLAQLLGTRGSDLGSRQV